MKAAQAPQQVENKDTTADELFALAAQAGGKNRGVIHVRPSARRYKFRPRHSR